MNSAVVGESTEQTVLKGQNVFDTRIPVQPGDQFGLYGASPSGALYCTAAVGRQTHRRDRLTSASTSARPRRPWSSVNSKASRVAVSAIVEPDVDGDGFGDETQDKCPQSAAFQAECPLISLDQFAVVGRSSITLLVIADHEAPVTVTATISATSRRARARSGNA